MTATEEARLCAVPGCSGPDGKPRHVEGARLACSACSFHGHKNLLDLPRRYVYMRSALRPGSPGGERVAGPGFGSTSPVRDAALSAMDEIQRWAIERETETREVLHLTARPPKGKRVVSAIALLAAHWDRAMVYRVGVATLNGADYWHRRTDLILGWDRLVHRLPAPCPYCDTVTLIRRDGDDRVRCSACHRTWLEAEYRHFVRMLLEEVS